MAIPPMFLRFVTGRLSYKYRNQRPKHFQETDCATCARFFLTDQLHGKEKKKQAINVTFVEMQKDENNVLLTNWMTKEINRTRVSNDYKCQTILIDWIISKLSETILNSKIIA
jgi:hypothetical protein